MKNIKTLIGGAVLAAAIGGAAAIASTNSPSSQSATPSTVPVAPSGSMCPSKAEAAPVSLSTLSEARPVCDCSKKGKGAGEVGKTTAEADKNGKKKAPKAAGDKNAKDKPATTA